MTGDCKGTLRVGIDYHCLKLSVWKGNPTTASYLGMYFRLLDQHFVVKFCLIADCLVDNIIW